VSLVLGMPYTGAHFYLRANGWFGSSSAGVDQWSTGWRIAQEDGSVATPTDSSKTAFLAAVAPAISTFHGLADTRAGANCYLVFLTFARIGADGKYEPSVQDTWTYNYPAPVAGVSTTQQPWTTALVYSLRTARPRGYASNGRNYWPATGHFINGLTGRVSSSLDSSVTAYRTMIRAINTAAGVMDPDAKVSVMSTVGAGLTAHATSIRVDDRLDSQERRENSITPNYVTAVI